MLLAMPCRSQRLVSQATPPEPDPWDWSAGRQGYFRQVFHGPEQLLLPELEIFGWLRFNQALPKALGPDRHADSFEIHYMARGHLRWWVEKEHYEFNARQAFIIRPNELHGAEESSLQPCEEYWLRIRFPRQGNLPTLTVEETQRLRVAYERVAYRTFTASQEVEDLFKRLLEEHQSQSHGFARTMARATLHALLITILRDHDRFGAVAKQQPLITWMVRRTREWLEKQVYESDVRLDALAQSFGITPSGLRVRFQTETGFTPREYLLHRRIEEARRRLSDTDDRIITIAHELGFPSSQYFATVFLRQTGSTPRAYRGSHRPE
jgi:AraC-like DNA-binding protein